MVEILRTLVQLSIALITVVIAVYAIAVSYLGRETHRSIWRKKKRREELERRVRELGQKADVEGIIEEKDRYEKEISAIDYRLSSLSVRGAVIYPSFFFLLTLAIGHLGIYVYNLMAIIEPLEETFQLLYLSVFFAGITTAIGALFMFRTLFAIEWTASKIPLPNFKISFGDGLLKHKYRIGRKVKLPFLIKNIGEDMAENVDIFLLFPHNFKVKGGVTTDAESKYPSYICKREVVDTLHIDVIHYFTIEVEIPNRTGSYEVITDISERKIGQSVHKLTVEVQK